MQSMKTLYKSLRLSLPTLNPDRIPIMYIYNGERVRVLFLYDKIKEVALSAYLTEYDYRYMSVFEMYHDGWQIISKRDAEYKTYGYSNEETLPF